MASEVTLFVCLFLCLFLVNVEASKLNVARILLPVFDEISTNFTLISTDNNCLKWTTTRDDIVKLTPVDYCPELDCAASVVISTNTKDRSRLTADIFAEDTVTQQMLRCVVIIDVIHSLAITTKTRELILEEAPEIFEVRAYDNQGNEFSTLAGVPLHWFISPLGAYSDMPVIKLTPFKDSSYGTPESLVDLEERGLWGDKVLIEGFKTGMSKVSVKLSQREYEEVKSNDIVLSVVANLIVLPAEVYILVGDVVQFRVIQTSYGKTEDIDLKTSQYYLKVGDANVASNEWEAGVVKGIDLGDTKLFLCDKNMDASIDSEMQVPMPSATIHVVQPAYMILHLMPHKNWVTMVSERHEIIAEIYTEDDRKLTLGSDFHIQTSVGEAFHVQERSSNGSWQLGWTEFEGTAMVTAVLDSIDPPLQASGEIVILPRIVLTPSEVILPWDPAAKPKYDIDLKATGGDGKFLWSSTNNSVGIVTQFGRVHTHNMGFFEVSAAMQKNHNNRQTAKFYILPPSKLEVVEFVMEAEIGTIIFLHVALYVEKPSYDGKPASQIPVTRCQDLNFKVRTTDPKFSYQKGTFIGTVGTACGNIAILSTEVGTGKVTISYQIGETHLQDSVSLTFFKPLKLLQPSGTIVLAVGSSTNLIFTGGPRSRTILQNAQIDTTGEEYVTTTDVTNEHDMPNEDEYTVVHVLCKKLGQSNVTLSVVNPPLIPICRNQEASTMVSVVCSKPRKLEIQPEIKVADVNSCPMDLSSERVVVQSDEEVDLVIKVLDHEGREFINVSSLLFQFETKPSDKADIGTPMTVYEMTGVIGSAVYANKSYQKITPKIETGEIMLTASITGYNDDVLRINGIRAERPEFADETDDGPSYVPINATISLLLVDDTIVTPNEISIYNHPSNKIQLDVKQGSGYYSISMTRDDVVHVQYLDNSRKLDIMPISNGDVSIKLIDLCLVNKPAQININVVAIRSIRAEMSDKVELGKCITCTVSLYDESGSAMEIPNLDLIEMSHLLDNPIASVERLVTPFSVLKMGELQYVISGTELGDTKLLFYIGDPDFDGYVSSDPMDLQVFPPLKIMPRNMILAVGSVLQYTAKGGPQPSSEMEFVAASENTATICSHGVATGVTVGKTKVTAKSIGTTPSGTKIIYTEDTAELQVINLSGIKIISPANRVKVGSKIPIWASGRPEQITPMILATIKPSIHFSWSVQDAHIARVYDVVENTKVEIGSPNLPFVRLQGIGPGRTVISLNATIVRNKKIVVYTSSMEVDIIESVRLIEPVQFGENSIHMATNSQTQLRTNAEDDDYEVAYRLMGDSPLSTDVQYKTPASQQIVTVSRSGLVQTHVVTGSAIVVATSTDEIGTKQCIIIPVEVKPVHYMMIKMDSKWQLNSPNSHYFVPLGSEFDIIVTYCDNLGNELIASGMESSLKTSRQDLAGIHRKSNDTFTISTRKAGITVLQVTSDCNERIVDYLKLNVTQVITPYEDELVVGDVLCFHTPVTMDGESGTWSTSDPATLQIDETTGIAVALTPGKATIFHSFHMAAPVQVTILPIQDIQLVAHNTTFTNTQEYKLHVTIQAEENSRTKNFLMGYDCSKYFCCADVPSPINCSLTFDNAAITPEMFDTRPRFDPKEGKHYCSISPKMDAIQKVHTLPKSDAYLTITSDRSDLPTKQVKLNFVPGVQVPEDVTLDGNTFAGTLTIYGSPDALSTLTVKSKDDGVLDVGDRVQDGAKVTYTVSLKTYENLDMYKDQLLLEVDAESSNQKLTVGVKVNEGEKSAPTCGLPKLSLLNVLHNNRVILSAVVGFILMITLCTYTYLHYIQQQPPINVNVCPCPSPANRTYMSPSMTMMDTTPPLDHSCYCTRSPEIRRNRRYL